ncbi:DNA polymerase [Thalassospira sp. CH_XMU1458]|uniref:DNA polymerase n=1 Tax=Thalassospira sp. CH_XMU1458 TaxID=3107776 RepID=UPI00300C8F63
MPYHILTFIKDYSESDKSLFFITSENYFGEIDATNIQDLQGLIITHDYWLIAQDIYNQCGKLPKRVIDLDELRSSTSRDPKTRKDREKLDVINYVNRFAPREHETVSKYKKAFYKEAPVQLETVHKFHELMSLYYIELVRRSFITGDFERFLNIEVPCMNVVQTSGARGVSISNDRLTDYRSEADHQYYCELQEFSDKYNTYLEVPSDEEIINHAAKKNVDISSYSIDFITNYHPNIRDYSEMVLKLRKIDNSRTILKSIALRDDKVHPLYDVFGSRTSRIITRNPSLQNLAKRYRDIIIPNAGQQLCYVDYGQFEVGIMAALSDDPELLKLYAKADMYASFCTDQLEGQGTRKAAKILFLAYAYGMKRQNLTIVAAQHGIDRKVVRAAFKGFTRYEAWKTEALRNFEQFGFVSTSSGNRFYKKGDEATKKEQLSAISQLVQGEGSLIFKKTIIEVSKHDDVEILLPMHDAVLFQHARPDTPNNVQNTFETVMTNHFDGKVSGKASIGSFLT